MLKFIGTGDLANVKLGNSSAYIIKNNEMLIIDCGVTVFQRIIELNLLKNIKNLNVIITHMHPDHVGSLASLIFYCYYWLDLKINVIIPSLNNYEQKEQIKLFLELQGVTEKFYNFIINTDFNFYDIKKIEYQTIKHSSLTSYAIFLKLKDKTIYYLGDNNDQQVLEKIIKTLNKNDLIYTDCTTIELKNDVHLSLKTLMRVVPEAKRKNVYCVHFSEEDNIFKIKELGFNICEKE